jgi:Na+/proline symporter
MSESTQLGANSGEGLRQRPSTTTTSNAAASTDIPEDMAYSTLRNKSRPVLATAISRAAAAAAAAAAASTSSSSNHNQSNTTCGRFLSGGQFMNNRELRRYRNRIVIFLAIVAIYTTYIYESGMCVL